VVNSCVEDGAGSRVGSACFGGLGWRGGDAA